jgi:RimJ/RimL family protein N-acetyltransferase
MKLNQHQFRADSWIVKLWNRVSPHRSNERSTILESDRLIIRFAVPEDAYGVLGTIDELVIERNGWPAHADEEYRRAVETGRSRRLRVIEDRVIGQMVGCIEATPDRHAADRCEIGFWIAAQFRKAGYASEAVGLLVTHLHGSGMRAIEAFTARDNDAVVKLLINNGFVLADERPHFLPNGKMMEAKCFEHTTDVN